MGGSSKKQTVGYKYYLGMHMVLCHGPVDFLRRIVVDNKTAASGFYVDGSVSINKPNLFGGEKREGGIVGNIDLEFGEPSQGRNDYLQARLGASIPAFRGVVGVVLRQVYLGVNPYLKRWSFRVQRINKTGIDGADQWYKAKAPIGSASNTALYLAIDISNSMSNVTSNGQTRLQNMKTGLEAAFTPLLGLPDNSTVDISVVAFAGSFVQITRRGCNGSDIQDIIDWINARTYTDVSNGTTEFDVAIGQAPTFFAGSGDKDRVSVFITDGEATGGTEIPAGVIFDSISDLSGYGINIDLVDTSDTAYLDNTPQDGIPVVDGGDTSAIENAVTNSIFAHYDMNPAHIIRECLTDLDWGMGYQTSDIDDTSFTACADTLFNEQMGISLLWDRQNTIEAFVQEIVKHIDAALYVDRTTGKFVLKLIRADYDENTLIELDESNVAQIQNLHRPSFGELVNSVTVNYWDYQTGETASLTVQDTALALMQQASINTTVQYPGFSNGRIAGLAAARDLKALSIPLWSCTVYADKTADSLNIGDTFKLSWADYGLSSVIMRVTGMAFGNSKSNRVKLICTQDVFALPETAVISAPAPEDGWTPIDNTALPLTYRMVQEAPYYELVQLLGQTAIDDDLTANPDLGYVMASGSKPSAEGSINALMYVDPSTGTYEDSDTMDFSPTAFLNGAIDEDTLTFPIENGEDLNLVEVGQHCQIDDEICRVDAISDTSLTLGRAVLDTVPAKHADGSPVIFWDNYPASDEVEYVASDVVNVKLLTVTGEGVLDEASAPVDSVTLASRAIRPYPPKKLQVNSSYFPVYISVNSFLELTWVHRDRLQETAGTLLSFLDDSVGPEVGTTYTLRLYNQYDNLVRTETGLTGTSYTWLDEESDSGGFLNYKFRFELESVRDSYISSFKYDITIYRAGYGFAYGYAYGGQIGAIPITSFNYPNLILAYTMDNISGTTVVDESGNGNDATLINGTSVNTNGGINGTDSIEFDGTDDYVNTPIVLPALDDWAICFWAKGNYADGQGIQNLIANTITSVSGTGSVNINVGSICRMYFYGSSGFPINSSSSFNSSSYSFIVVQRVSGVFELWFDSNLEASNSLDTSLSINPTAFRLGANNAPSQYFFDNMDQLRYFDRSLTSDEIALLFTEGP